MPVPSCLFFTAAGNVLKRQGSPGSKVKRPNEKQSQKSQHLSHCSQHSVPSRCQGCILCLLWSLCGVHSSNILFASGQAWLGPPRHFFQASCLSASANKRGSNCEPRARASLTTAARPEPVQGRGNPRVPKNTASASTELLY